MKKILLLIWFILLNVSFAQNKKVCFTIDDLPLVCYGIYDSNYQKALFENLLAGLVRNNIPAIGFVNTNKMYYKGALVEFEYRLLEKWVDKGLELGNHTYSHPDYNKVTFEYYANDIKRGEREIEQILSARGKVLKYFRHPFLYVGNTKEKADSLEAFLSEHNYITAPVTIDNEEYLFALAYKRASVKQDSVLMKRIGHDYVSYMEDKLKYYEKQADKLFGRDINQILLFHSNLLNSDYIDSLAAMFRKNNYEFVSLEEALEDDVYKTEVTVYGDWGISWLDRWALSRGKKGEFFKDDPGTPEYIKELTR